MAETECLVACLGGGLASGGTLPAHIALRVDQGVDIAGRFRESALLFSSSFTLNKPPVLDSDGRVVSEASAMAACAVGKGYEGPVYCEQQSHDTIGSAYFIFSDFVSFLNPLQIRIVTSDFHAARAEAIFRHTARVFAYSGPLDVTATPAPVVSERTAKENAALADFEQNWLGSTTPQSLRQQLFVGHSNYNFRFCSETQSGTILDTY